MKITSLAALFMLLLTSLPLHGQGGRFSFAYVSDTHVGSENAADDLRHTVDDINAIDTIAFVILAGDVTEFGSDAELRLAREILDRLNKPWYVIPGNHDAKWSESGANTFRVVFGSETFFFTHGNWLFIGTNSGPNMRMGPGQIPRENIVWLDSLLAVPASHDKMVISVNHYPLDEGLNNWYELTDRLKLLDTRLALCGHGHSNRELSFEGIPALMGRSNLRAGEPLGGYNIMTIAGDTLLTAAVRHPGQVTMPAWATVRLVRHDYSSGAGSWPRPDYSMNETWSGVKPVWEVQDKADIGAGTTVAGKLALVATTAGEVKALRVKDGRIRWSHPAGAKIYSTPATDGKRVIAVSADGMVRALSLKNGRVLWSYDTRQPVVASPVTDGQKVFIAGSSGRCVALDISDGTPLWSYGNIEGFVETRPLICKGMLIFGTWGNRIYALDTESGEPRWVWDSGYANRMLSPAAAVPVAVGERLFVVSPDRKMTSINLLTGETIWRSDLGGVTVRESMGLSADSTMVLAKAMNGEVIGVSTTADEPEVVWRTRFDIGYDIAPATLTERDGIIFIPSDKGVIHAASRTDGSLLWSHRISSCLINNIVPLGNGSLITSSMDGVVTRLAY